VLTTALTSAPLWLIVALAGSLLVAGTVKGTIGVGMPVVAFPLVSALIDVRAAVMLLTVPLIISNIPQAFEGGATRACLNSLVPVLCGLVPGIFVGSVLLLQFGAPIATTLAGFAVVVTALLMLTAPALRVHDRMQLPAGVGAGFFGGVLGGLAAMPGPLVFIYLLARGSRGRGFTKQASLFLVLSAALMALALTVSRQFDWTDLALSTLALAPVGLGMVAGQRLRDALPADTFKTLVLAVVLLAGLQMLYRGIFT
jgi:uncharacterized membrane protein YfcA